MKDARDKAEDYRRMIESGINPVDEIKRREEEDVARIEAQRRAAVTFKEAAIQWIEESAEGWAKTNPRREKKVR